MNAPVLTFFNNKGGVGKTSLIYHLAWMFCKLGKRVVAVDLDPQANLTAAFLDEDRIETIWDDSSTGSTVFQCVKPLMGVGDITQPRLQEIQNGLYLLPGDVGLSRFEDSLSVEWPKSMDDQNVYRPMRILTSFWHIMQMAAQDVNADLVLVDVGPNLGTINRSVLLATDYVLIPLGADLFSLQGLRNLGPSLINWRTQWNKRLKNWNDCSDRNSHPDFQLPQGRMEPVGYLCQQHGVRLDRPVKAFDKWVQKIPAVYQQFVLNQEPTEGLQMEDSNCLATIKHYRSLIPMAQEARKPVFSLTSADGAIGSHFNAVQDAKTDFDSLARKIAARIKMNL